MRVILYTSFHYIFPSSFFLLLSSPLADLLSILSFSSLLYSSPLSSLSSSPLQAVWNSYEYFSPASSLSFAMHNNNDSLSFLFQTHLVRQEEKAKLEKSLVAKESELLSVRNQLQEVRIVSHGNIILTPCDPIRHFNTILCVVIFM